MKPNHETIYLVPTDYDGGQLTYSWCDCPAPGEGMDPADAIKYVRADLVPASNEVLAKRIAELTKERDALAAQLTSKTDIANQLKDGLAESFEKQMELKAQVEQLRNAAQAFSFSFAHDDEAKDIAESTLCRFADLQDCIAKTPAQCLAEVKAQAINKHTHSLVKSIMAVPVPAENEHANTRMRDVLVNVINHANQLRQAAKAGE